MGFNEEIEQYARELAGKYPQKAIDTALRRMKERNTAGEFEGWAWIEIQEEFLNEISRRSPRKSKPYRSGKRGSK